MRNLRKAVILISVFIISMCCVQSFYALTYPSQPAPKMLEVYPLYTDQEKVGYNVFDGYYADVRWQAAEKPSPPDLATNIYQNMYLQEITKAYRPAQPIGLFENTMAEDVDNLRLSNLKSGTIYYSYLKAYFEHIQEGSVVYTSPESLPSNTVRFLTDIDISVEPHSQNRIKIVWDDVWSAGTRINYKLYVSESSDFSNTPPIYITKDLIGPGKPIRVDEETGKLEYIHRVNDAARVYYIRIAPDVVDDLLTYSPYSKTVSVASYILARTLRMASTEFGTVWKLEWTPVITGLDTSNIDVVYHIYRGVEGSGELPNYMAATDDNTFFVTMSESEDKHYFVIRAIVTRNSLDVYPGIKIESEKIEIKEAEIPAQPPTPEIVEEINNNFGEVIASYTESLKHNEATVYWRSPKKGTGNVDLDVVYDVWLITDPGDLDTTPDSLKVASSIIPNEENFVIDNGEIKAFKYTVSNLNPNATYYFKIVAKKAFIDYEDGVLTNILLSSEPAFKVVITPAQGPIDQPVVPSRPPLLVKKIPPLGEIHMISEDSAVITIKNKWYEKYNSDENKWEYISEDELLVIDPQLPNSLEDGTYNGHDYRITEYDQGVTIDVGCIPYYNGFIQDELVDIAADWVTAFPAVPNDPDEDFEQNIDGKPHNIDINVTGLLPNTSYIIWIRASRLSEQLVSGPSDPLIITTLPVIISIPERPLVPEIKRHFDGDNYIDLGWDVNPKYSYILKYGVEDSFGTAADEQIVTASDMMLTGMHKVTGLSPQTIYYFWIQAFYSVNGTELSSEWSSSYSVLTKPYIPPNAPKGFGIKPDGILKNSIDYEWIMEDGIEYVLEIADNANYNNASRVEAGESNQITIEDLRSNLRYYARLYAYDPEKDLFSKPTNSVAVKTLPSDDDYDSGVDTDLKPVGDYIIKDATSINGIWKVKLVGVNADRLVEAAYKSNDYDVVIDLYPVPLGTDSIKFISDGKVFDALSSLKKNIIFKLPEGSLVIRPNWLNGVLPRYVHINKTQVEIDMALKPENSLLTLNSAAPTYGIFARVKSPSLGYLTVKTFNEPLQANYSINKGSSSLVNAFMYASGWPGLANMPLTTPYNSMGGISFELGTPGYFGLVYKDTNNYIDISDNKYRASINTVYDYCQLKSVAGKEFYPDKTALLSEAAGFALNILGDNSNNIITAKRAMLMMSYDNSIAACTREQALNMAARIYEIKTRSMILPANSVAYFTDMNKVNPALYNRVAFALKNGVTLDNSSMLLEPKKQVSRGELMHIFERALRLAGEI